MTSNYSAYVYHPNGQTSMYIVTASDDSAALDAASMYLSSYKDETCEVVRDDSIVGYVFGTQDQYSTQLNS